MPPSAAISPITCVGSAAFIVRVGGTGCHSLFIVSNNHKHQATPTLGLHGCTLRHLAASDDIREIGAALFVYGDAKVEAVGCSFWSAHGYSVWLKHQSAATIRDCTCVGGREHPTVCILSPCRLPHVAQPSGPLSP